MTGIMTLLSETSNQAVWMGLDVAAKATVVLLLAVAVNRLLTRRVLARAAVWNASLVGLILLPLATALFPRLRICCLPPMPTEATVETPAESPLSAETAAPDEALTAPGQGQDSLLSLWATGLEESHSLTGLRATAVEPEPVGSQAEPSVGVEAPSGIAANPATSPPRWPGVIVCVYLLGVAILALRLTVNLLAVRRLRGQSVPLEDSKWTAALAAWRERLGIRQAVQLGVSSAVNVPIQIGWLRPMVILPAEMIAALEPARHGSILLHELAHVRRRDYAWQILLKLVQIIYWPHPLIWLAGRMIGANREQVCDDLCVHHSSSAGQYRATLLEVASVLVRRPAASLGIAMARTSKIGTRIDRIDRGCRLSRCLARWPVRLAVVAAVLVTACMIAPVELAHRNAAVDTAAAAEPPASQPAIAETAPAEETAGTNIEPKAIADFRKAVAPKYVAYVTAIAQATRAAREHEIKHPRTTTTGWRDDPKVKETGMALIRAIEANWPFPQPLAGIDVNTLREQMAESPERPFRLKTTEAKAAFKDASDFRSQYHEGKATRDQAVARFVAVADKYPESYEHDQALINAWGLCTQGLVNGAQADPETAASLMKRLAGRPGQPSAEVLMAELEVSGLSPDPATRLNERIEFYERSVARLTPEWLTANMLLPSEDRSRSEYTARLQAVALHLPDMQYFAATGMASDAFVTSDSLGNLSLLAHRYKDDRLVLAAVEQRKQQMRGWPATMVPETRPEGQPHITSSRPSGVTSTRPPGFVAHEWGRHLPPETKPAPAVEAKPAPVTTTKPVEPAAGASRTLDVRVVHLKTSQPIADAEAVFNFEGEPQVTLKTDSGGRCQFRYPDRPGHHGLNVRKAGLLSLSYWGDRVNSIPPNLTFKMEPGVGIGGFVKNSQGQPVAKAEVKVGVGSTRQEQLTGIRVNTYHEPVATDERGHWEVAGVPSDLSRLHVTAKHPDYLYRELNPGTGLPVGQLLDKSAVIVLEEGIEVSGRLLDEDGKPIAELPVLGTETDQDGRFHAVGIEPSSQGFLIKVPGYLTHSVGTRIYAGMPPLEIRLQRAITVRGRVTDTAGNPVKGTHISTQLQQWLDTRVSPHGPMARTDADGRFVLEDIRPDKWMLCIYDNNYQWFEHKLTVTAGEAPPDLHLVLQPPILSMIRGVVLAKDGVTPVAGAIIGNDRNLTSGIGTPTDQNGRFELPGHRPGKHWLHAWFKGYAPISFTAEVAADGTSPEQRVVLDKVGGTITGRGFDAVANAPLADEVIVACLQDNLGMGIASHLQSSGSPSTLADLERHRFHGIHYRTQTGKDGTYQFVNLPEGFYTVCLIRRSSTKHLWKEFVHVREGDTTADVDLTLKPEPVAPVKRAEPPPRPADKPAPGPAGSLSGIVYLPDGKTPAKGIKVAPYTKNQNRHNMLRDKIAITSADGAFSFDGLAAGRCGVYAWLLEDNGSSREDLPMPPPPELARSVPTLSSLVQVKPGQATTGVKVTLKEGAVVRGTVTDADTGQPMAGAWVSVQDHRDEFFLFGRWGEPRNPFAYSSSQDTFTDAQGRYAFYCMPAQRYRLNAGTQNDKHDQVNLDSFTVKKGEDRTIDVQLHPARYGTLAGRVFMPDGRPAPGAEVYIGGLSNKTVANEQGRYRAERVRVYSDPHTSPSIFARAENTAMTSVRAPKMKPGQTVPFDIRLVAGGTITGRVMRADGSAPKDGTLACLMRASSWAPDRHYRDVLKPENRYEHFWVRVESDGSYRLEHIPPNKYHLFALSDDKPHNIVRDLNVKDGATLKKDLKLSP